MANFFQSPLLLLALAAILASDASAFSSMGNPKTLAPVDQALEIFGKEFEFSTKTQVGGERRKLTDISEQKAKASFQELAKAYGNEQALMMVKTMPICLAFDKEKFGPSLKVFQELFGEEEAREMVARNPGLLAVTPNDAASSNEQTMVFSYIVAYTRPLGPLLIPFLLLFLSSMVFEVSTGVSLRSLVLQPFQ